LPAALAVAQLPGPVLQALAVVPRPKEPVFQALLAQLPELAPA
jgi:hypothetical protein